jgi:catechol 2,3-dioxygenase-like lactoylglutathione lyase family enzyme
MFDHVSIGVRDLARSKRLYDAALRPLDYVCLMENADALGYGREKIALWIGKAEQPVRPDMGSGLHFCFGAPTREVVDAFHVAAVNAGGADNGAPGLWHGLLRRLRSRP